MPSYHYSLDEVSAIVAGVPITEYAKGDAITISYLEDDWKVQQGHHGSVIRSKMPNTIGDVKITVLQGSPINDLLTQLAVADRNTGLGAGPFQVKDTNGTTLAAGSRSWIQKIPEVKFGTEAGSIEWAISVADLSLSVGGNRPA